MSGSVVVVSPAEGTKGAPSYAPGNFNPAVLNGYLRRKHIGVPLPGASRGTQLRGRPIAADPIELKSADDVKNLLSHTWETILQGHNFVHQLIGCEMVWPEERSAETKQQLYNFTTCTKPDDFPPHLELKAGGPGQPPVGPGDIFDPFRYLNTVGMLQPTLPAGAVDGVPAHGQTTMEGISSNSRYLRANGVGVQNVPNVSDRLDWHTDAVFAQQFFTGPNPMVVKAAPADRLSVFLEAAKQQGNQEAQDLINKSASSLWVADYSYFRAAAGMANDAPIINKEFIMLPKEEPTRYGGAPIVLFHLSDEGQIHPSAIILDYMINVKVNPVTIFNERLRAPTEIATLESYVESWPWRYAKTCAIAADWVDHELRVHLTEAHFIDESIIVGTNRAFPDDHAIHNLLEPHWTRTLSLNSAARATLVPAILVNIGPFGYLQTLSLVRYYYKNYDWQRYYLPNELSHRGFPLNELGGPKPGEKDNYPLSPRFRNFSYARNMVHLWPVLKNFVSSYLQGHGLYETDQQVANDANVQQWVKEMTGKNDDGTPTGVPSADFTGFPRIKTRDQLVEALTMSINIASPQHNAINYLQNYYMAFVASKPSAMYTPLPTQLDDLSKINEKLLLAALPVTDAQVRQWLLASHLPWLLSFQPEEKLTLLAYARTMAELPGPAQKASAALLEELIRLGDLCDQISNDIKVVTVDNNPKVKIEYTVMHPSTTAVSILL